MERLHFLLIMRKVSKREPLKKPLIDVKKELIERFNKLCTSGLWIRRYHHVAKYRVDKSSATLN